MSAGFERPYGWGWLLYLHLEASRHEDRDWAARLEPLARAFAERFKTYLAKLTYPIRVGTHFNTAFALILALEWAEAFDPDARRRDPRLGRSTGSATIATARRGSRAATSSFRRR